MRTTTKLEVTTLSLELLHYNTFFLQGMGIWDMYTYVLFSTVVISAPQRKFIYFVIVIGHDKQQICPESCEDLFYVVYILFQNRCDWVRVLLFEQHST
jgi:hypothetical protein